MEFSSTCIYNSKRKKYICLEIFPPFFAPLHAQKRAHGNGLKAPVEPNMSLMTNTKECTFVWAVSEAPTAQEAVELWNPKVKTTPAKKLKRLNTQSPKAPKEQTSSRGGSRGRSRGRGRKYGRGDSHRGGHGGQRGGGRGGYRGRRSTSSRGPTIVQKGIHYHTW